MHPTFYFSVGFMLLSDYNSYAVTLFVVKAMDIATKMVLIKKVFMDRELSHELTQALLAPIHYLLPYVGVIIYPALIYLTFN